MKNKLLGLTVLFLVIIGQIVYALTEVNSGNVQAFLKSNRIVSPDKQTLTLKITDPFLYDLKDVNLRLQIIGNAKFEDGKKELNESIGNVENGDITKEYNIQLDSLYAGAESPISIIYTLSFRPTNWRGDYTKDIPVTESNTLTFTGVVEENRAGELDLSLCRTNFNTCSSEKAQLSIGLTACKQELEKSKNQITSATIGIDKNNKDGNYKILGVLPGFLIIALIIIIIVMGLVIKDKNDRLKNQNEKGEFENE